MLGAWSIMRCPLLLRPPLGEKDVNPTCWDHVQCFPISIGTERLEREDWRRLAALRDRDPFRTRP
jgi:hypothetical protein